MLKVISNKIQPVLVGKEPLNVCVITRAGTLHMERMRPKLMFLVIRTTEALQSVLFIFLADCWKLWTAREREKERDWDSMYHGCAPEESQKDSKVSFFLKGGASFRNRLNFISAQKKKSCKKCRPTIAFWTSKE